MPFILYLLAVEKLENLWNFIEPYVTTNQMGWTLSPLKVISSLSILPYLNENPGLIYWFSENILYKGSFPILQKGNMFEYHAYGGW